MEQACPGSTATKGSRGAPWPPPPYIMASQTSPECPHSLTALSCRFSTLEISPVELPFTAGHMAIIDYCMEKSGTSLDLQAAPSFRLQWNGTQASLIIHFTETLLILLHCLTCLALSLYYNQARGVTLGTVLSKVRIWTQWSLWVSLNSEYSMILWPRGPSLQSLFGLSYTAYLSKNLN